MTERIQYLVTHEPSLDGWYIVYYDNDGASYDAIGPYETRESALMVQGLPVHGYQEQSPEFIAMVNRNKIIEERVLRIMDSMRDLGTDIDQRWLAIGRTHIEQGFMSINRAIFQPQRIQDIPTEE